jgi:hypothetical protein
MAPGHTPSKNPTPITEVGGFQTQESSDAAATAAAVGLTPELPTETAGVGNLAFFKAEDAQKLYCLFPTLYTLFFFCYNSNLDFLTLTSNRSSFLIFACI